MVAHKSNSIRIQPNSKFLILILAFCIFTIQLFSQISGADKDSLGGTRRFHILTTSGSKNFTLRTTDTLKNVNYIVVGGGGGGGLGKTSGNNPSGFGGSGGSIKLRTVGGLSFLGNFTATVGAGGAGASTNGNNGTSGGNSSLSVSIVASGGVGGNGNNNAAQSNVTEVDSNGVVTLRSSGSGLGNIGAGGAGGLENGVNGTSSGSGVNLVNTSGAGGAGYLSYFARKYFYGAGGGGGVKTASSGSTVVGVGGKGGGGAGSQGSANGANATGFGCGGGGSEAGTAAGSGSSGIIIFSYDAYDLYNGGWVNGAPPSSTSNGLRKVIASGSTYSLSGNIDWGSDPVTIESGATLDLNGKTLTCGYLVNNGGAITINGTLTCNNLVNNGGTITINTGGLLNANYTSAGFTIPSVNFNNLTISHTSGISTAGGSISVSGLLTIASGGTLNMGNNLLTVSTTLSNSGTIVTTCPTTTSATPLSLPAGTWGGTIEYGSTSAQNIIPGTYTNLTLSGGSIKAVDASASAKILTVATLLTINSSDKLDLSSSSSTKKITLTVKKFAGTGSIKGSLYSALIYDGNSNSTLYMDQTNVASSSLDYLKLTAQAVLTLGNRLNLTGGSTNALNGDLELGNASSITSNTTYTATPAYLCLRYNTSTNEHAWIGGLKQNTTPTISGELLFEDMTTSGTRWYSQIGFCTDSLSLNQLTDDFDLWGIEGSGTSGRGNNGDGLFKSTSTESNSIFIYDESKKTATSTTSRWVPFTYNLSTLNTIPLGTGIMLLMRPQGSGQPGNYNSQLYEYEGTSAIISKTKSLTESAYLKGLSNPSYSGHGYNLLCNPYPSHLDLNSFFSDNSNLNMVFVKYDRFNKTYRTYSKPGSKWVRNSSTSDDNDGIINPGDAFWVTIDKTKTSPSIATFNPSQISNINGSKPGTPNKMELDSSSFTTLGIGLFPGSDTLESDAALLVMNSSTSNMAFDSKNGDAFKFGATCNEMSILSSEDMRLSIKTLSQSQNWTVPLKVETCTIGTSKFRFGLNYNKPGQEYQYYLVDKFKNTTYKINNQGEYSFEITQDPATYGSGRFFINGVVNPSLSKNKTIKEQINIYPNPSSTEDILYMSLPTGIENVSVEVQNNTGQLIKSSTERVNDGFVSLKIGDLKLQPGIYFLSVSTQTMFYTEKLIIR